MSSDITQSGTSDSNPEAAATSVDETVVGTGISVTQAGASETAPPTTFNPTMRDVDASTSETGMTVPPRPMAPDEGEAVPCTGPEADQALILGPPDGISGETAIPVAEAEVGTSTPVVVPPETPAAIDPASLFRDWAVMWSGNPSEVGAGLDPSHGEVCLCDETSLTTGEGMTDLAS